MNISSPLKRLVAVVAVLCGLSASPGYAQQAVTVVEYYNKTIAAYFLTGRADEQSSLDGVGDFQRTGMTFTATAAANASAEQDRVCRYRISLIGSNSNVAPSSPFSSHFYGLTTDCDTVASYNLPNFANEGLDFAVTRPIAGVCPASAPVGVYRALRSSSQVSVPNHRYSVDLQTYDSMLAQGWNGEGIAFCVPSATAPTARPGFVASSSVQGACVSPRPGTSPSTGRAYPDRQGSINDELSFVRAYSDETYLWYREIPNLRSAGFSTGAAYFEPLKSPAVTFSGLAKDKTGFHYSRPTSDVENTNAGISYGYGITWSFIRTTPPRQLLVAVVSPGSPADLAGVKRGDSVLSVDGVDLVNNSTQSGVNALNAGLFPSALGAAHTLVLAPVSGANKSVVLQSAQLTLQPVPVSGTISTGTGKVGYIAFTTFNSFASEGAIANAVAGMKAASVNDLVLDLRYNGGGYLYIASQLSYMIAGQARTSGKTFELSKTNDKKPFGPDDTTPFYSTGSGYAGGVASTQALPTLNLGRVFVLTTSGSCSASEALINALRGIDVQVILIGSGATCGKPFGFYGTDNCGTTYFTIQFTGVNAKGEGDYVDGFSPTCAAADDLTHALGDPAEGQLAAALAYRTGGACSAPKSKVLPRINADAGGLPISDTRFIGQNGKLMTPGDLPRDAGVTVSPRAPTELGALR